MIYTYTNVHLSLLFPGINETKIYKPAIQLEVLSYDLILSMMMSLERKDGLIIHDCYVILKQFLCVFYLHLSGLI